MAHLRDCSIAAAAAAGLLFQSCAGTAPADTAATAVYIDVSTSKVVVSPAASASPAVNPATGKRTLVPAAYCDQCRAWHRIPPLEQVQRNPEALVCPKTKTPLRFDGPKPDFTAAP